MKIKAKYEEDTCDIYFKSNDIALYDDTFVRNSYAYLKWSDLRQAVDFTLQTNYDDDNNVGTYKIECYDLKTGKKVLSGKNTSYTISNTYKGRIYKFRVKQEYTNPNTKKKYYTEWSDYKYALPEAVSFAQRTKAGTIKVTWDSVSKATGYDIYVKKSGGKLTKVASVGKGKTSYTIKKVNGASISGKSKYEVYVVSKKKVGKKTYVSGKAIGTTVY